MTTIEEPTGTAAGSCRRCGTWSTTNRIVAEVHSDSGAGMTIVQCPQPCERPIRAAEAPRTWPG